MSHFETSLSATQRVMQVLLFFTVCNQVGVDLSLDRSYAMTVSPAGSR